MNANMHHVKIAQIVKSVVMANAKNILIMSKKTKSGSIKKIIKSGSIAFITPAQHGGNAMAKSYSFKTRVVVINKYGVATQTKIIDKSLPEIIKALGIELVKPLELDDLVEIGGDQVKDD